MEQDQRNNLQRMADAIEHGRPEDLKESLEKDPEAAKQNEGALFTWLGDRVASNTALFRDQLKVMLEQGLKFDQEFWDNTLFLGGELTNTPAVKWWALEGWKKGIKGSEKDFQGVLKTALLVVARVYPERVGEWLKEAGWVYPALPPTAEGSDLSEKYRCALWGRVMRCRTSKEEIRGMARALQEGGCPCPEGFNIAIGGPGPGDHQMKGVGLQMTALMLDSNLDGDFERDPQARQRHRARLDEDILKNQQVILESAALPKVLEWLHQDNFDFGRKIQETGENILHVLFHHPYSTTRVWIPAALDDYVKKHASHFLADQDKTGKTCFDPLTCGYNMAMEQEDQGTITVEQYRAELKKIDLDQQIGRGAEQPGVKISRI